MSQTEFKAVIVSENLKTTNKQNGGISHLHRAEIQDGPLAGKVVLANRTVLNKDKQEKKACSEGDSVILHMSQLSAAESTTGKRAIFFEIAMGESTATNEELFDLLDNAAVSDQKIGG